MKIAALIVAAGRGSRAGGEVPKQYAMVGGAPVIVQSLRTFGTFDAVAWVQCVIHPDDAELYGQQVGDSWNKLQPPATGGATRQASVLAGLLALEKHKPDAVLIHDAARPFVERSVIEAVVAKLRDHDGAIAAVPLTDTLKRADAGGIISATVDRTSLWRAQTPQGFRFDAILKAHRDADGSGRTDFTDDAAIAEWAGLKIALVEDSRNNFKLTTAEDLRTAEKLMNWPTVLETRTGTGFDVHKFCARRSRLARRRENSPHAFTRRPLGRGRRFTCADRRAPRCHWRRRYRPALPTLRSQMERRGLPYIP